MIDSTYPISSFGDTGGRFRDGDHSLLAVLATELEGVGGDSLACCGCSQHL